MTFIDISVSLSNSLPTWPGSPGFELQWLQRIEDDELSVREIELPLYDENLNPLWFEHPQISEVDIVVLKIDELRDDDVLWRWTKDDYPSQSEILAFNSRVSIVGYPLGFYDDIHNFPITRSASIASPQLTCIWREVRAKSIWLAPTSRRSWWNCAKV